MNPNVFESNEEWWSIKTGMMAVMALIALCATSHAQCSGGMGGMTRGATGGSSSTGLGNGIAAQSMMMSPMMMSPMMQMAMLQQQMQQQALQMQYMQAQYNQAQSMQSQYNQMQEQQRQRQFDLRQVAAEKKKAAVEARIASQKEKSKAAKTAKSTGPTA